MKRRLQLKRQKRVNALCISSMWDSLGLLNCGTDYKLFFGLFLEPTRITQNPGGMWNISRWCEPPVIGYKTVQSPGRGVVDQIRMSSNHLSLHYHIYHIVFGTKNHEPLIQPAWRGDLHAYLGGIIRTANGIAESVGGVSDHVHLLIGLRATHRLADVLRELKAVSSGWVHDEIGMRAFAWQEGYGAFTCASRPRAAPPQPKF